MVGDRACLHVGRWGFQGLDTASSHPREAPEQADSGVEPLKAMPERCGRPVGTQGV